MSEIHKAGIRIASNYVRLFASICLGLLLVRLLLRTVGKDAFGLIALLTSSAGIVFIVEEIVGWSMIRELGAAHHSRDKARFVDMYNSAVLVCAAAALIALVGFALLVIILPLLNIPDALLPAATWFVVAKAVESAFVVLLAPQFNMYLVLERMVAYNGWLIAKRAAHVLAAMALVWFVPPNEASGLIWYGWISAGLHVAVMVLAVLAITFVDRRLVPSFSQASWRGAKAIVSISGWNVAILGSQVLGLPAGAFLMNFGFGLLGNTIFAMSTQLAGYARMVASGMTGGLDAVAARLSSTIDESGGLRMRRLLDYSTRLHAIVAFPAAIVLAMLPAPLLQLWVGREFPPGAPEITASATLTAILVPAFAIMCLGDNWMRILYGAGQIRRYAPIVVVGGFVHLILAGALLVVLPEPVRYTGVAVALTLMYAVFHLGLVPLAVARAFDLKYVEVVGPLGRPFAATIAAAPILVAFLWYVPSWNLWWLLGASGAYGAAYLVLCWIGVLSPDDRRLLAKSLPQRGSADEAAVPAPVEHPFDGTLK